MPPKNILLLGGHGKVSLLMTPKLLSRSWNVTSVIRNPDQKSEILSAGKNGPGKISVLIESIEDVKSQADAQKILDKVKPDTVIWSAGAGGKGGVERTNAIDRDACIHFIRSAIATQSVVRFMVVSALSIRRNRAPWFDDESYALMTKVNTEVMPGYYKAKLAADDVLAVEGMERNKKDGFGWISLRPGRLTDDAEVGKVSFGKTRARGEVTRADVAEVGVGLLEKDGVSGWYDLLGGDEEVGAAVDRVLNEKVDCMEGEDLKEMRKSAAKL
ncbi:NAD(P)-binding protein [Mollisia scopiformis]|uniref:NAD(P)-binding protein n=1 Tax=Mollisia scopiformis TaxID=149040 RepID=A0A194WYF7_MOLSC|nr:NAD(P)-binding protein [Mollisia scopiformis]KUJ12975.1 NAD(P)-binding protein [Mollisia scopiformis]